MNYKQKRAQGATELIIILAIALVILLTIFAVNTDVMSRTTTRFKYSKAKAAVNDLGDAAELVYQQGAGSKTRVYVNLPNSIDNMTASGKTIAIAFKGDGDTIYRNLGFNINGTLPTSEGFYWICVESHEDGICSMEECAPWNETALCGNALVDLNEECDDGDEDNNDGCKNDCTNNVCGDTYIYTGVEDCEGDDLAGEDCIDQIYEAGTLACYANCSYDVSACYMILPYSVTNLANQSKTTSWIYWNWTNPGDADFNESVIYIDGDNVANTSNNFYNATGLLSNTSYTITVHTKDDLGNVNDTDVNSTATTLANASVSSVTYRSFESSSQTIGHTVSGANGLIVVSVGLIDFSKPVTSITYAGDALTKLTDVDNSVSAEVWYRVNPQTGSNNVVINLQDSNKVVAGIISYSNIDQNNPISGTQTDSGTSSSASVTVSSEGGDFVQDVIATEEDGSITAGSGQTEQWDEAYGGDSKRSGGSTEHGAASVDMDWTLSSSKKYALIGFNINAG